MSTPYDPYSGQQQPQQPQQPQQQWPQQQQPPADPAAPTQFMRIGDPAAGQQPPQAPAQPGYGAPQDSSGGWAQPQQPQQQPAFGAAPQQPYGAPPQQPYDAPQQPYGAPQQPGVPGFGQGGAQQYAYPTTVAEAKAKRSGGARAAGAIFGTVLGRLLVLAVIVGGVAIYHVVNNDSAQRNSNGQVTKAGTLDVQDLQVGDCFDKPSDTTGVSSVTAIPCSQPHDSQIYAEPKITESTYPGVDALKTEADTDCGEQSEQASVSPAPPSGVEIYVYFPEDEDTFNAGTNFITCALWSSTPNLTQSYVTGS